jgi:hypothetical protein
MTISSRLSYQCNLPDSAFTLNEGKEFCSQCQTTIADFTVLSDEEIRSYIAAQSGSVCVKIYSDQLRRVKGRKSLLRQQVAVAATATLLALATETSAQTRDTTRTEQVASAPAGDYTLPIPDSVNSAVISSGEKTVQDTTAVEPKPVRKKVFLRIRRKEFYVMNRFPFFGTRYMKLRGKF